MDMNAQTPFLHTRKAFLPHTHTHTQLYTFIFYTDNGDMKPQIGQSFSYGVYKRELKWKKKQTSKLSMRECQNGGVQTVQ